MRERLRGDDTRFIDSHRGPIVLGVGAGVALSVALGASLMAAADGEGPLKFLNEEVLRPEQILTQENQAYPTFTEYESLDMQLMGVLEMMVRMDGDDKSYFEKYRQDLQNDRQAHFAIIADPKRNPAISSYSQIDSFYFQDGIDNPQYDPDGQARPPDVYTRIKNRGDGNLKSIEVWLQLKPDGTLEGSDPSSEVFEPTVLTRDEIKRQLPEHFLWANLIGGEWIELEDLITKNKDLPQIRVIVAGFTDGQLYASYEEKPQENLFRDHPTA